MLILSHWRAWRLMRCISLAQRTASRTSTGTPTGGISLIMNSLMC
jgi:hypothetical protein